MVKQFKASYKLLKHVTDSVKSMYINFTNLEKNSEGLLKNLTVDDRKDYDPYKEVKDTLIDQYKLYVLPIRLFETNSSSFNIDKNSDYYKEVLKVLSRIPTKKIKEIPDDNNKLKSFIEADKNMFKSILDSLELLKKKPSNYFENAILNNKKVA